MESIFDRIELLLSVLGTVTVRQGKITRNYGLPGTFFIFCCNKTPVLRLQHKEMSTILHWQAEATWLRPTRCEKCSCTYLCEPLFFAWLKRRLQAKSSRLVEPK